MLLRLLTAPIGGPVAGFRFLLEQIRDMAEQELYSEDRIREQLLLLQLRLEEGEIGEDEYAREENEIMARLRLARARRQAMQDELGRGDPRSEVEVIVDQP
jgi:hypothetical protein